MHNFELIYYHITKHVIIKQEIPKNLGRYIIMNGQKKNSKFHENQINEYIQTHNIYESQNDCNIDLHALGDYIKT